MNHIVDSLKKANAKKLELQAKLIEPARAAANQMKDAGMHRGADPVLAVLFEIDAADQEFRDIFHSNKPEDVTDAILSMLGGDKGPR